MMLGCRILTKAIFDCDGYCCQRELVMINALNAKNAKTNKPTPLCKRHKN